MKPLPNKPGGADPGDLLFEFSESYYASKKKSVPRKAPTVKFTLIKAKGEVYYVQRVGRKTVLPYHKDFLRPII